MGEGKLRINKGQIIIILVIVVVVAVSSYTLFGTGNGKDHNQSAPDETLPPLPAVYTAQPYGAGNSYTLTVTPTPTFNLSPPSPEGYNGDLTKVNQQIVTYLSQQQDYTNVTVVSGETDFWNAISSQLKPKMDYTNSNVTGFAYAHVSPQDRGPYNVAQISDVFNYVEPNWHYNSNFTCNETVWGNCYNSADQSISNGLFGVCADYAILMASTNIALGGDSRLIYFAFPNSTSAHMYAEAKFNDTSFIPIVQSKYSLPTTTKINYHNIATVYPPPANWLSLDWTAKHPGGPYPQDSGYIWIMYKNGDWEKVSTTSPVWQVVLNRTGP